MLKHVISTRDFNENIISNFVNDTYQFIEPRHPMLHDRKILATLFLEPSTRTRLSFESAMIRIGGFCIGVADKESCSVKKGETLYDTIRTVGGYADAIVLRTAIEGSAALAASCSTIPIINGGDSANQHPSQTLTDFFTIHKNLGRLESLNIGYMGDLKYGRTVHSLVHALSFFHGIEHHFIPPDPSLTIEEDHIFPLITTNQKFYYHENLEEIISDLDVLYVTRLQAERFQDPLEYGRIMKHYQITPKSLEKRKKTMIILHPLPRNDEIHKSVDELNCSKYFEQAHNGVPVRMNLLYQLIEDGGI